MSLTAQTRDNRVKFKDGRTDATVPRLSADKRNHYIWAPAIIPVLQGKGLFEGITVDPDKFLVAAAARHYEELEKKAGQRDDVEKMLEAMMAGDDAVLKSEMEKAEAEGPSPSTLRKSTVKKARQPATPATASTRPPSALMTRSRSDSLFSTSIGVETIKQLRRKHDEGRD